MYLCTANEKKKLLKLGVYMLKLGVYVYTAVDVVSCTQRMLMKVINTAKLYYEESLKE